MHWYITWLQVRINDSYNQITMKSFSRQLAELFSYAGYKSNAKLIPCSVTYSPLKTHQKLTYKCDVALKLYDYYKKHGFKYSEKGVTPRTIAQEIELFLLPSKHYEVNIDSFGYFNITPSQSYLQKLEKQIESNNEVKHVEIVADSLTSQKWHSENRRYILIPMDSFTLSNLRIAYYLNILRKKYSLFKQYTPSQIITVFDMKALQEQDLQFLIKIGLIKTPFKTCSTKLGKKLLIETNQKIPSELIIEPKDQILSGTLRHNYIPFTNYYKQFMNESSSVLTFGEVIPDTSIHQINKIQSEMIPKVLAQSLKYKINVPMNLLSQIQEPYIPEQLIENIKNRKHREQLLILLDQLYENKVIELLALKKSLLYDSYYKPFHVLYDQLKLIV